MMEQAGAEPFPARHLLSAGIKDFYTQDHLHTKDWCIQELYVQHISYSSCEGQVCAQNHGMI